MGARWEKPQTQTWLRLGNWHISIINLYGSMSFWLWHGGTINKLVIRVGLWEDLAKGEEQIRYEGKEVKRRDKMLKVEGNFVTGGCVGFGRGIMECQYCCASLWLNE